MRGEIWTVSANGYASKPRPAVVVQSDAMQSVNSTILCLLTSERNESIGTRVVVEPSEKNGLETTSYIMTDKIVAVRREALGRKIGELEDVYIALMNRSLEGVLGLGVTEGRS